MIIDDKTFQIARRLGYQPIKGLDKNRLYVLLAEKNGKNYVIKTEHLDDEADLLEIFNHDAFFRRNNIIIPKLYEHSKYYVIQDFISGKIINVSSKEFNADLRLLLDKLELLVEGFKRHKNLSEYTKGWNDQYLNRALSNSEWLKNRIKQWFSSEHSKPKYRFTSEQIVEVRKLLEQIKGKTTINYGAFSSAHIRINKNSLGIFDFGKHLRWAPKHYDRAYLWWSLLFDNKIQNPSPSFWFSLAQKIANNLKRTDQLTYWVCIIERLAGLSKDLTPSEKNKKRQQVMMNIRNKMTPMVINQLKNTL